jgi:hypothetical protein
MSNERGPRRKDPDRIRTAPHDALRVNLQDAEDTRYWCRKMHCTEHQLREAIDQVGPLPSNVEAFVNQRTSSLDDIHLPPGKRPS